MIVQIATCALALALLGGAGPQATESQPDLDWKQFTSTEGAFSIVIPGRPAKKIGVMPGSPGRAPGEAFSYEAFDDDTGYAVSYTDWFGELSVTIRDLADAYRKAYTDNPSCAVLDERAVRVQDYEGHEFRAKNGGAFTASRIFLVRSRVYTLTATTDEAHGSTPEFREKSRRFLESFAPLDR